MASLRLDGIGALVVALLDAGLLTLHWRANRPAETSPSTGPNFGANNSWTKFFFIPELLAAFYFVMDGWRGIKAVFT